jgi:signal transduction histidine kinase
MHDIVAHNLAVVIALADGAVFAARESPEQATAAMEKVSRTGREALAEMRLLLGVLNDESAGSRVPQPGIPELEQLVAQVRTTGVPVDLEVEGDPAGLPAASTGHLPDRAGGAHQRSSTPGPTRPPTCACCA